MELHAYTRTVSDLLSVKKQYLVPRFQREYSWTKEQVLELWDDIASGITVDPEGNFLHEEYFIGALVLVGDDKSSQLQIVDGQQRLTTLTILLSVLAERFQEVGSQMLAEAIYENFIAGKDDDGKEYFKLVNESPKPFFQRRVQHLNKEPLIPKSEEERTLLGAYDNFRDRTSRESLAMFFTASLDDDETYRSFLKEVRDQVLRHLKVIFITVKEEDEAYTIFETLNARGLNLSSVDLIKNRLFRELAETHPDDRAKTAWNGLRGTLRERDGVGTLDTFVRHWWLSKYSYVSADNVYKQFKRLVKTGRISPREFIESLSADADLYVTLSSPLPTDFPQMEEREIFDALSAFRVFGISQQKPFVLSLLRARSRGVVTLTRVRRILKFLEKFHFLFNAVCSLRPSGIEGSYSRAARDLEQSKNKRSSDKVLSDVMQLFSQRIPDEATFVEKFGRLRFDNKYTKQRRLIQYIFAEIERHRLPSREFRPEIPSIEHIRAQARGGGEFVGRIGNLLPISKELNEEGGQKDVSEKILIYRKSAYQLTRDFAAGFKGTWENADIQKRTVELAHTAYRNVWAIEVEGS